jgi:hypothetical protein
MEVPVSTSGRTSTRPRCATLLLNRTVPRQETLKQLLPGLRQLSPIPQYFNRTAVSSYEALPGRLPIWTLYLGSPVQGIRHLPAMEKVP